MLIGVHVEGAERSGKGMPCITHGWAVSHESPTPSDGRSRCGLRNVGCPCRVDTQRESRY